MKIVDKQKETPEKAERDRNRDIETEMINARVRGGRGERADDRNKERKNEGGW